MVKYVVMMSFTTWELSWNVLQQFTILKGHANYWKTSLLYWNFWPSLMLAVFLKWVFRMYNHSYLTNLVHKTVTGRQVTGAFLLWNNNLFYIRFICLIWFNILLCFLETLKAKYVSWNVCYSIQAPLCVFVLLWCLCHTVWHIQSICSICLFLVWK